MGTRDGSSLRSITLASTLRLLEGYLKCRSDPDISDLLRSIRAAVRHADLAEALRQVDRAWRFGQSAAETLAPLYGRLLSLEGADFGAALHLLERVSASDPDTEALVISALSHLQRDGEAQRRLEAALVNFCVVPGGLLNCVATRLLANPATESRGWIGIGPNLEIVGELRESEPGAGLQIQVESGAEFTQLIRSSRQAKPFTFRFELPLSMHDCALRVSNGGLPLIGGYMRMPPPFGLDGRTVDGRGAGRIDGWVRIGWTPAQSVRLCLVDENNHSRWINTGAHPLPGFRWPFHADLRRLGFRGHRIEVLALLPNGHRQPLPDTPLLLPKAATPSSRGAHRLALWHSVRARPPTKASAPTEAAPADVIIPVYQSRHEALACIDAVLATVGQGAQVIVVDDASDDAVLRTTLEELAKSEKIRLLRNPNNLGFVGSVNRALALNPTHDALLLNSDALVFGDWLTRLRRAAYSAPKIGSVTPFSNSGSIVSYPLHIEQPMSPDDGAALHALAAETNSGMTLDIPVGVGFCLYLRRQCLTEVGAFDAAVFGKGYGEETDFCLRARQRGWTHVLAADVFVCHSGGKSFGPRRAALLDRSQRLLNLRHPGFDRFISDFLAKDPLRLLRRRMDERRLAASDRRFVLLVTLALSGGVERFVADRCREIYARNLTPLLLRPAGPETLRRCELWTDALAVPNLRYDIPSDLSALKALLRSLPIEGVEIQHFLHLDSRVIDAVRSLDVPYDVFIHDYAWICPRVTLIDGSGRYCGEPPVATCNGCVRRNGSNLGEKISVSALRERSASWLRHARRVFAPTHDTAARYRIYFNNLNIEVRAHVLSNTPSTPLSRPEGRNTTKVAIIGAIGVHKGYSILLKCARDARARRLPIEFVVVGYTQNDAPLLRTGKVFITGRYAEGEAPHLLRREQPDAIFLPSVWPETWSYTLDDAIGTTLPIIAFDIGAIAERLRAIGQGILLPMDCEPSQINEYIMQSARERSLSIPNEAAMIDSSREMNRTMPTNQESLLQESLSASVQLLPLPAGLYLFSVKAASPSSNHVVGQLQLPAMHVGLGPGVRSEQVEFVAGPATDGAWLFAQDDMLVTKVGSSGATLMLTSVRAPGGEVLSIQVLRLESRSDATNTSVVATGAHTDAAAALPAPNTSVSMNKTASNGAVPVQIQAHVRARGDMTFTETPWAGRVAPGLWIESFAITPLREITAQDIEIKGLTGSGFETPWISDGQMCGTKGMAVPLVGFAVRLKPGPRTSNYDCEYSGSFKSGSIVGPLRNGAPCRSTVANDPLEGIQIHIFKRLPTNKAVGLLDPTRQSRGVQESGPAARNRKQPRFGASHGANGHELRTNGSVVNNGSRRAAKAKSAIKGDLTRDRKRQDSLMAKQRPAARRS